VRCQLDYLAHCNPVRLERALDELPATLDETYERVLGKIDDANWEDARRLFQCIAVASRPLQVEELADILTFDFEAGPIPKFRMESDLTDPEEAVLSMCPTLLSLVDVEGIEVVQFAHFSVKEFLTSTRFFEKRDTISRRYYISMTAAHTVITQACLGILLELDKNITRDSLTEFPLAEYAARHWFEHARVDGVSESAIEGMKEMFDQMNPHFAVWLWIFDPSVPYWRRTKRAEKPFPPHGTPLHYAAFCGLCDVAKGLAIDSKDVNSQYFFDESTPLHLSSREGHVDIVRFLVEHGANTSAQDQLGQTPLHVASWNGHLDIARILVEHGANASAQDLRGSTPLYSASANGHLDIARFLVEHGANTADQDRHGSTPLHSASGGGHLDIAQFLVEHGANAATQDGWTPLHGASWHGHLDIARFLVEHGTNVAAQDQQGRTPLHEASVAIVWPRQSMASSRCSGRTLPGGFLVPDRHRIA
jgi:ankyrin repeat protein